MMRDIAMFLLRLDVGLFFAISGFHKLFIPTRHEKLRATLVACKIPCVAFNVWWVPLNEFIFGILFATGFGTMISGLVLIVINLVAMATDGIPDRIPKWKPINFADWVDDLLYLQESQYIFIIVAVLLLGAGAYSVDAFLQPSHTWTHVPKALHHVLVRA